MDISFSVCYNIRNVKRKRTRRKILSFLNPLSPLRLPTSLQAVPVECFCECTSLKIVEIPDGYTEVSQNAFYECTDLQNVRLPDGLESVGGNAFGHCIISAVFLPAPSYRR